MQIQMVDLRAQVESLRDELRSAFDEVLESGSFIRGPHVERFEEELASFVGARFAIGVGNGTDALQIALMALGVGPGDEVIVPSFTFVATAEPAVLLGARPVFVDVDPRTFNIDPSRLPEAITPRTRAIIPVHLFGQAAEMGAIAEVAARHGVAILEDAAQAIGARFGSTSCGCLGHLGCLSFYPSKNLGAFGDGGAILTNDEALASRARTIANHGATRKYHNEIVGVNSRLDALQAAMLSVKLAHLDGWTAARQAAADRYDALLAGTAVTRPFRAPGRNHVFHQYTLRVPAHRRDALRRRLRERGIPTMVYYPIPLHRLPVFSGLGYGDGRLPVSEMLAAEVVSLPMHPHLSDDSIRDVAGAVVEFLEEAESVDIDA